MNYLCKIKNTYICPRKTIKFKNMKKLFLSILAVGAFSFANAQDNGGQTAMGKWLVEANTAFGFSGGHPASTGINFASADGSSIYSIGGEAGYFIMDDLAVKLGLGYSGGSDGISSTFSYKVGAKYYVIGMIPVQVDYTGASTQDVDENPSYVGVQAGYAWFLGDMVSIEPGLRYNLSMNSDFYNDVLEFNVGFALHF